MGDIIRMVEGRKMTETEEMVTDFMDKITDGMQRIIDEKIGRPLTEQEKELDMFFTRLEVTLARSAMTFLSAEPSEGRKAVPLPKGTEKMYALATLLTDQLPSYEAERVTQFSQDLSDYMGRNGNVRPSFIYNDGYIFLAAVLATGGGETPMRQVIFARERAFEPGFLDRVERINDPNREFGRNDDTDELVTAISELKLEGFKDVWRDAQTSNYPGRILWSREREDGSVEHIDRDHIDVLTEEDFKAMDDVQKLQYMHNLFGKRFYQKKVQFAIEMSFISWSEVILFDAIRAARKELATLLSDLAAVDFDDENNHFGYEFGPGNREDTIFYAFVERWQRLVMTEFKAVYERFQELYTQSRRVNVQLSAEVIEVPIRFLMTLENLSTTIVETITNLDEEYLQCVTDDFTEAVLYVQSRVLAARPDQIREDVTHDVERQINRNNRN